MAARSRGRSILIGVALGVVTGTVVGLVGAAFAWPVALRGAIVGLLVVVGFTVLRRVSTDRPFSNH